jgi:hypothetical protein
MEDELLTLAIPQVTNPIVHRQHHRPPVADDPDVSHHARSKDRPRHRGVLHLTLTMP